MGSSPGLDKNIMWGGLPAELQRIGGFTHTWDYSNIIPIVCVESSSTSKSRKSPYDLEGDGATENSVNE